MPNLLPVHFLTIGLAVLAVLLQVFDFEIPLRYGRSEILESAQWWRVLTGNLVHLGYSHLLLNLSGLALISLLVGHALSVRQWVFIGLCSMLGVGFGLLTFNPELSWYVGLSGALYGLLLAGAIAEFNNQKLFACALGAITVGKIVWEQLFGAADTSEKLTGGTVIVDAHLYGMLAGGMAALLLQLIKFARKPGG